MRPVLLVGRISLSVYLDGAQNFVFEGSNQHIYQAVFNGASWTEEDITADSHAPAAEPNTPITAFTQGSAVGVVFTGVDEHVYESVFQGASGTWGYVDLTYIAGLPNADATSALSVFIDAQQHFVYQNSGNIFQAVAKRTPTTAAKVSTPKQPASSS